MAASSGAEAVGISAREAEVLAALGEHRTNAEIGAQLFISVRTVESHVSSLLRKLGAADRRALAALAARGAAAVERAAGAGAATSGAPGAPALPTPLTSFVGRVAERAAVARLLESERLVTAVGPGGIGKTRLALRVAADVGDRFPDGTWYVDLVPVSDPAVLAAAVVAAGGLGEQQGRSPEDGLLAWLGPRRTLLVLDNCEHLVDGVAVLLERLLAACPGLVVLATSRARLLVPYERVFAVPGLSVETGIEAGVEAGAASDAVALFAARAAAAGSAPDPADLDRVAALCHDLDGTALAIELAAARFPSVGLAGLEAGLADRLRLLAGGRRVDDRHRSLRATLDWSHALLDEPLQAALRRAAVFAAPFSSAAAERVVGGWPPVASEDVPDVLAGLADQSLLVPVPAALGTRYRALETVRQYGAERLVEAGEAEPTAQRHLEWCGRVASSLEADAAAGRESSAAWRAGFDVVAEDLRAALARADVAAGAAGARPAAHDLALLLASLCFTRGLLSEAQRRYEQAAELAADDREVARALALAAGAAEVRHVGADAVVLRRRAADAAVRAGEPAEAAVQLARATELVVRGPGMMATVPPEPQMSAWLAEARDLAGDDPRALARVLTAEAFRAGETGPDAAPDAEAAIAAAQHASDVLTESAALDQLCGVQLAVGDLRAALASTRRRADLLDGVPVTATSALELLDGYDMLADCALAAGEPVLARRAAEHVRDLPFHREEEHLGSARTLLVALLVGDLHEVVELAGPFRESWERAGRPRAGNLSRAAYAAATAYGLRGDDDLRAAWLRIVDALFTPDRPLAQIHVGECLDAQLLLHRGEPEQALDLLTSAPESFRTWYSGLWRPWYAAMWVEAAVLTRSPDAGARLERGRAAATGNVVASAVVERAAALLGPPAQRRERLVAAAAALHEAGCRYQWARTLVLLGGDDAERGAAQLAAVGATPTVWPASVLTTH